MRRTSHVERLRIPGGLFIKHFFATIKVGNPLLVAVMIRPKLELILG